MNYNGVVKVFRKPNGLVITQMQNDSANEDFLSINILEETRKFFHVSISFAIKGNAQIGWIKKANYIGAYYRQEKFPMDLVLYKTPDAIEKNEVVIINWTPTLLSFCECRGNWILVSLTSNGKTYRGWIEEKNLCANAYTTCN